MNNIKKLNAAIALALMCFVFTSAPLNAVTLAQAKEALAIYEARGDFETAAEIRKAIQEAGMTTRELGVVRAEEIRQRIKNRPAYKPIPKKSGFFDEAAYFFGFGEKAAAERRSEQANQCATSAAEYYRKKRYEAAVNPSTWQLDGYESAEDYAGAFRSSFYRRCASR